MAKPNYRQQKKQREEQNRQRRDTKLRKRIGKKDDQTPSQQGDNPARG